MVPIPNREASGKKLNKQRVAGGEIFSRGLSNSACATSVTRPPPPAPSRETNLSFAFIDALVRVGSWGRRADSPTPRPSWAPRRGTSAAAAAAELLFRLHQERPEFGALLVSFRGRRGAVAGYRGSRKLRGQQGFVLQGADDHQRRERA